MNDQIKELTSKITKKIGPLSSFMARHRFILVFLVACGVILITLLQTRIYTNPERNDARFETGKSAINVFTIDQDIVDKLSKTSEDQNIEVDQSLVPNRNNPFIEQ